MYIKIDSKEKITRGEGTSYRIDNYLTKNQNNNISVAVSHLHGKINKTKNTESDRIYYFIKANARFKIDNEIIDANDGDVIFISKNTLYSVEGNFDAVLINTPAFDIKNEISEKENE